ncbi:MAG TPA: prolyl oligopeptidase family serine peptidase [Gemmatimonadaceae bacterium]|nr:prolyl oligopeptidase family serine peptidase [Gemmatimonadaceae bacterium]
MRRLLARFGLFAAPLALVAQQPATYNQPPAPIPQMLDAEPLPAVSLSPQRNRMLLQRRAALPGIEEISTPYLALAGDRVSPRTNGSWYETSIKALAIRNIDGSSEIQIASPPRGNIISSLWSPDGRNVAFIVRTDSALNLWVADAETGKSLQLTRWNVNGAVFLPCSWATTTSLLCRMVIPNRASAPKAPEIPNGPVIQETEAAPAAGTATFQNLLQNQTDEARFDYYYATQLASIALDGNVSAIGKPGIYITSRPSPDGQWILVQALHRPWSYQVPRFRFPTRTVIWSADGRVARTLADVGLQDRVPNASGAVATGLRQPSWRADAPATVVWVEALDNGDPAKSVPRRDRVLALAAPFTGDPQALIEVANRFGSIIWGRDNLAIVDEYWDKTRKAITWTVDPSRPGSAPKLLWDRSYEDAYTNPGTFATTAGRFGHQVLFTTRDESKAFLIGLGASPAGDRPFLDRFDFSKSKSERLWRSEAPHYEQPIVLLDADKVRFLTRRESLTEVPNYFIRDPSGGNRALVAVTQFKDPGPQFAGVAKQLITYRRDDGIQLSATLYLPPGYDKSKGPLPFLFWAYPQEFKSASAASQVTGSPYRFTRPTGMSHLFMLTQDYGVLDNPTMPIVGEGDKEPNDSYVTQLVASAKAAVDKVVGMGVADRNRIAVGGHSYGAFMTANLLAHSSLFRAGIARSGAYNRTLTPFGFQAEDRNYWKARDVYMTMSPFNYADSLSAPILLIHGMADDNQGTFPVQSERFFAALKGNGKKARLVMLPAEPHGYRARQSLGHTLWEMTQWLDKYVKPPAVAGK